MPEHSDQPTAFKWDTSSILLAIIVSLFLLFGVFLVLMNLLMVGAINKNVHGLGCQSNLKQLGLALIQYEQDSDGVQPVVTSTGNGWREAVFPYVKAPGVYLCWEDVQSNTYSSTNLPRSYSANHLGPDSHKQERGAFSGPGEPLVNIYKLNNPATTIVLADTRGENAEEWNMTDPAFLPNTSRELFVHVPRHLIYERVTGVTTVLLIDGHVKSFKPMATLTPINLWTRDNAPFTGQELSNAQAILKHAEDE